jgi:senataxin
MAASELYQKLIEHHHILEEIPSNVHLLCPRNDDDDEVNFEDLDEDQVDENGQIIMTAAEKQKRVAEANNHKDTVYNLSLLLGIDDDTAGHYRPYWSDRVNLCLTRCDFCVRMWHRSRDDFITGLQEYEPVSSLVLGYHWQSRLIYTFLLVNFPIMWFLSCGQD